MNIRRKYIATLLSLGLILMLVNVACEEDVLDKKPLGQQTSETFFETEAHAVESVNAIYSHLRSWGVHIFPFIGATDIISDDAKKGSVPGDGTQMENLDDFVHNSTNSAIFGLWNGYYQGVSRANRAINNIPGIKMDDQLKERLIGEAKFLRAYFYFFLVRGWGDVPLIKKQLSSDEYRQAKDPASEVYDLIISDLKDAMEVLPLKSEYSDANLGRATKGAARGLLAKVYLFQGDYENTEKYADQVINSGQYSLMSDVTEIHSQDGEFNSGSIFEIASAAKESTLGGSSYSTPQRPRGQNGWGFNNPTHNLMNAFEPGDPRLDATVLYVGEPFPEAEGHVRDHPDMEDEHYNQKNWSPKPVSAWNVDPENIRRLRYADVLLMAAEAKNELGKTGPARTLLNQVRERARDRQVTVGMEVANLDTTVLHPDLLSELRNIGNGHNVYGKIVFNEGAASASDLATANAGGHDKGFFYENLDIITQVDGTPVTDASEFWNVLEQKSPGETMDVTFVKIEQSAPSQNSTVETTVNAEQTIGLEVSRLLPDITTGDQGQLREAIWHERRVELAMEQHRFFDIVRQGRAAEVMQAAGKSNFEEGTHEKFPIPQTEIDLSGGRLTQNSGY